MGHRRLGRRLGVAVSEQGLEGTQHRPRPLPDLGSRYTDGTYADGLKCVGAGIIPVPVLGVMSAVHLHQNRALLGVDQQQVPALVGVRVNGGA